MRSLFDPATIAHLEERIAKLRPDTQPLWGKMNSAQMLAHCAVVMHSATDEAAPRKQMFVGKVFMLFMKNAFTNDKPWDKNSPTSPDFKMSDEKEFTKEKEKLLTIIHSFHKGGPAKVTKHPSVFWGHRPPEEWAMGMYKHMDHHFQQFGI